MEPLALPAAGVARLLGLPRCDPVGKRSAIARTSWEFFLQEGREIKMKKLAYQVSGILLVVGLSAGPALAAGGKYKSTLNCSGGATGSASINKKGDVKIKAKGLSANTTFSCEIICGCVPNEVENIILEENCDSNNKGKLNFKDKGGVAGITCACPAAEIENLSELEICTSGI